MKNIIFYEKEINKNNYIINIEVNNIDVGCLYYTSYKDYNYLSYINIYKKRKKGYGTALVKYLLSKGKDIHGESAQIKTNYYGQTKKPIDFWKKFTNNFNKNKFIIITG